ncbi:hypothetical protein CALVIDRAFT_526288 [Calocera viscosa TUFC12733]|uniref:Mitochondrial import inner membrane translocase subunit TIM22 n=1 Tax=Calocera viscosa (strain TUFC12733) TaxID=1330018 RepID=A0A167NQV4_CALVF|nr:hypothetical protein CALVIDRAFT_526288 [Calocera viscosa TUFC12733]
MATTASQAGPSGDFTLAEIKARLPKPGVPWEDIAVPVLLFVLGGTTGMLRGSRMAALQFAAENTHRAPKNVQGWYFYQKTKNYRVILGGVKGAAWRSFQLGGLGVLYVGTREAGVKIGMREWSDVLAGTATGGIISAISFPSRYSHNR